jgi:mutator protein MutT
MDKYCSLLFLRKDDQLLLAMKKRGFGMGYWNGVGGKIEPGETLEEALVRETQEEIGVTPTIWDKVAEIDFVMDSHTDSPWHMYVHAHIASEWEGEPLESDEMAPKWFHVSQLPFDHMWEDDKFWLPIVLRGKKVAGTFSFVQENALNSQDITEVDTLPGSLPTARP